MNELQKREAENDLPPNQWRMCQIKKYYEEIMELKNQLFEKYNSKLHNFEVKYSFDYHGPLSDKGKQLHDCLNFILSDENYFADAKKKDWQGISERYSKIMDEYVENGERFKSLLKDADEIFADVEE